MYTFTDRGDEQITLRPENTAGVARALISGGLARNLPLKFFYSAPCSATSGRRRPVAPVSPDGIELLGIAQPQGDVEIIATGAAVLRALGSSSARSSSSNTLATAKAAPAYRRVLVEYLADHRGALSATAGSASSAIPCASSIRGRGRPPHHCRGAVLRRSISTRRAATFFAAVTAGLTTLGLAYRLNPRLVRGLDYYCHTCFEFTCAELGAQNTIIAGGRYDGLVEQMGGPATPASAGPAASSGSPC